jgi:hypothetical protein
MTRIKVVDSGAFGMPDMFSENPPPRNGLVLEVELHAALPFTQHCVEAYIQQGFLKAVYADGSYDCWNTSDVRSYSVAPE